MSYVLRNRRFSLFWSGSFIALIGGEMQNMALSWYLYQMTGSALALGLTGLFRLLPLLGFSLIAGHISDTRSRRKVLFFSVLIQALGSLSLAILVFTHTASLPALYGLIALNSLMITFGSPARQAILPALVPRSDYFSAISLGSLSYQASLVLGPSVAGFIIYRSGAAPVFLITSLCYVAIAMIIYILGPVYQRREEMLVGKVESIKQGMRFVKQSPLIWNSMILDFIATFFASAMTLLPVYAQDILRVGPQGLGLLYAAPSIGALVTGIIFSSRRHTNLGPILMFAVGVYGVATAAFGLSQHFLLSLVCLAIMGGADMISSIIRGTIRQLSTPDHLRGRMVSINMMFYSGGPLLGEFESGLVASLFGPRITTVSGGLATVIATVAIAHFLPTLFRYRLKAT